MFDFLELKRFDALMQGTSSLFEECDPGLGLLLKESEVSPRRVDLGAFESYEIPHRLAVNRMATGAP